MRKTEILASIRDCNGGLYSPAMATRVLRMCGQYINFCGESYCACSERFRTHQGRRKSNVLTNVYSLLTVTPRGASFKPPILETARERWERVSEKD